MQKRTWIRLYRTDPYFERLVRDSGVVQEYTSRMPRKRKLHPSVNAVPVFWDMEKARIIWHVEMTYGETHYLPYTVGLKNALYYWFSENWERWMRGEWHD